MANGDATTNPTTVDFTPSTFEAPEGFGDTTFIDPISSRPTTQEQLGAGGFFGDLSSELGPTTVDFTPSAFETPKGFGDTTFIDPISSRPTTQTQLGSEGFFGGEASGGQGLQKKGFLDTLFKNPHDPKSPLWGTLSNLVFDNMAPALGFLMPGFDSGDEADALTEKVFEKASSGEVTDDDEQDFKMGLLKLAVTRQKANQENLQRQFSLQFLLTLFGVWYGDRQQKKQRSFQKRFYAQQLQDTRLLAGEQFERQRELSELSASSSLELARIQNERFNRGGGAVSRAAFTDFTGNSGVSK